MPKKIYKFKNVKHSVLMKLIEVRGGIWLENADYPGLLYQVESMDELEEVK